MDINRGIIITTKNTTNIFIVDDHPIVIEGLKQLLVCEKGLKVCGHAYSANSAFEEIRKLKPDLVIIDISLKGGVSGLELIKAIKKRFPYIYILTLSMYDDSLYAERSIRAGSRGYVKKEALTQTLIEAIRQVMTGKIYLNPSTSLNLIDELIYDQNDRIDDPVKKLSNRELEVFQLMGQGLRTSDIAKQLNLSVKTIDTYRRFIKRKLKIENSIELYKYAVQWMHND